jgi:signal peptidase I
MQTEPWLAVTLSTLMPGVGHFYARRVVVGVAILVLFTAATFVALWCAIRVDGDMRLSLAAAICSAALCIGSGFHAFRVAKKNNPAEWELQRKSTRDPWLALFLTRIFPGLGHIYLRQWGRAFGLLGAIFLAGCVLGFLIVLAAGGSSGEVCLPDFD